MALSLLKEKGVKAMGSCGDTMFGRSRTGGNALIFLRKIVSPAQTGSKDPQRAAFSSSASA
nr:hypothetical protein [Bacillaceae bacterium]